MTTPTPRTDARRELTNGQLCGSANLDLCAEIETELTTNAAELEEAHLQMDSWIHYGKDVGTQLLREARAAAFEEAAEILIKDGYWNPGYTLRAKAAEIRKVDLMRVPAIQGD